MLAYADERELAGKALELLEVALEPDDAEERA
jgi:hypothetical protein